MSTTNRTTAANGEWVSCLEARSLLGGLSHAALTRLIASGRLGALRVPGARPRVRKADVDRLARESLTAAAPGAA